MAAIVLKPSQLAGALRAEARFVRGAIRRGAMRSANRGKLLLVQRTKEADKVGLGQYINSFEVTPGLSSTVLAMLTNTAPMAGVIELGARPHPVSDEGREAIARWAVRKLGVDEAEAKRIAEGVAWKLRHKGQKGTYIFRGAQDELAKYFAEAVRDVLREHAGRVKPGGGAA